MATLSTKTSLIKVYEQYSTTYTPDAEVTVSLREVGEFVAHINEQLRAEYEITPKAPGLNAGPQDVGDAYVTGVLPDGS